MTIKSHVINTQLTNDNFQAEIHGRKRFRFGQNWHNFLETINEEKILKAENSLKEKLCMESLQGKRFLDIGSGSGLFSLAARRLGASVHSFDYDPESVACAEELRTRFFNDDKQWLIEQGSALNADYITSLGKFDVVYSWGVLHHTGSMWKGLKNVLIPLATNGSLFIAIYNDQEYISNIWQKVKRTYCSGLLGRAFIIAIYVPYTFIMDFIGNGANPVRTWRFYRQYFRERGMSRWHDLIDWLGGYPFEVAKPEAIFHFYRQYGLQLVELKTCGGGLGCNEFVFLNTPSQ